MKLDNTLTVTTLADPEDEDYSVEYEGLFMSIRKVYDQSITRCIFQFLKRNWNMLLGHWFWFTGKHFSLANQLASNLSNLITLLFAFFYDI